MKREACERWTPVAEDIEEGAGGWEREGALSWHVWSLPRPAGLLSTLAPQRSPGVRSSSADPSSLIYSLFYLYVWSQTLSEQVVEGISPR